MANNRNFYNLRSLRYQKPYHNNFSLINIFNLSIVNFGILSFKSSTIVKCDMKID